jgi:hypothetical protein
MRKEKLFKGARADGAVARVEREFVALACLGLLYIRISMFRFVVYTYD